MEIIEDFVSYEIAKLLKSKRFCEKCIAIYDDNGTLVRELYKHDGQALKDCILAPTIQMTLKWLRLVHNIHIETRAIKTTNGYMYQGRINCNDEHYYIQEFDSYEGAIEEAILKTLKDLIK